MKKTNNPVTKMIDSEKIKLMSREDLESIVNHLAIVGETFSISENERGTNLADWFREYVMSEDFNQLSREQKVKVFDNYEMMRYSIKGITDFLYTHNLGIY